MERALSPVVGLALLVGLTVVLSATVVVAMPGEPSEPEPKASLALSADAASNTVTLIHEGGDPIDVTTINVTISVDGETLDHQPPVPFFAAVGFESGPTGAFNLAGSTTLRTGERASVTLASTNEPPLEQGSTVTVRLSTERRVLFEGETTA